MSFFNLVGSDPKTKTSTIQIMDQIGKDWWTDEGTEAVDFIAAVRDLGELENVVLEINSPGGNVHQGVSIANFIKQHSANWTAKVIGNAASIASVIACACDEVEMGVGTNFLVHKPSSLLYGMVNADSARDLARDLDTIEDSITEFYQARLNGKTSEDLTALMREDRYMSATEAIEWGFADKHTTDLEAVACAETHTTAFKNFYDAEMARKQGEVTTLNSRIDELEALTASLTPVYVTEAEIIKALKSEELTMLAHNLIDAELTEKDLKAKVENLVELRDICATKQIEFASIGQHLLDPVALVSYALNEFEVSTDRHIDGNHDSQAEPLAKAPSYDRAYAQFKH